MAASLFAAAVLVAAASAAIRIPTGTNELFSYAQPALGLRHCDFQAFATQQDLGLAEDYMFNFVPALNKASNAVSIQSVNYPDHYLTPTGGDGVEPTRVGISTTYTADDASWTISAGLSNATLSSLSSLSANPAFAGLFLTVTSGALQGSCAGKYQSPAGDVVLTDGKADPASATWLIATGPPPQPVPSVTVYADNVTHTISELYLGCHSDSGYTHQPRGFYSQLIFGEVFERPWLNSSTGNAVGTVISDAAHKFNGFPSMSFTFVGGTGFSGLSNRGIGFEGLFFAGSNTYEGFVLVQNTATQPSHLYLALNDYTAGIVLDTFTATIPPTPSGQWQQVNFTFTPSAGTECVGIVPGSDPVVDCGNMGPQPGHICVKCGGEFVVGLYAVGTINVGYSFLQPGDWGRHVGQPVLLSAAQNLQALGVNVLRQGGTFAQTIRWKDWRGPAPTRASLGLSWGQSLISGWGMFEMIDLANSLNIEPIITLAMDLNTVQDWADLVEYLHGGESSTWGAQRIADGHPAVYNASWFELGNEQYNPNFVAQVQAMEAKASTLGLADTFRYMFPTNQGLSAADAAKAQAAGLPPHNIMPDIHIEAGGAVQVAEQDFAAIPSFQQSAINCETNAGTHDLLRALQEASDLNDWFSVLPPTNTRLAARTASFCTERSGHFDGYDQGISFFLPNMTWIQPPGYVQQIISKTWANKAVTVATDGSAGADFSITAQLTADSGSLVVRIVNSAAAVAIVPLTISGATTSPSVTRWVLTSKLQTDANTPAQPTLVAPVQSVITIPSGGANVTVSANSYTVLVFAIVGAE